MGNTSEGAIKALANKAGIPLSVFLEHISMGLKWCYQCKTFHPIVEFGKDSSRYDGLTARCTKSRNQRQKVLYVPVTQELRKPMGPAPGSLAAQKLGLQMKAMLSKRKEEGFPPPRLGIKHSLETRIKMSVIGRERSLKGKDCHSFKDGKCAERRGERLTAEYKRWRYDVYTRDRFTCQLCGDSRGGNLCAHHILDYAEFPALRFYIPNGITVCKDSHKEIHYGRKDGDSVV